MFGIGLVLFVFPMLLIWFKHTYEDNKISKLKENAIKDLKDHGLKISVAFIDCDIKSNNWIAEEEKYSSQRIQMWNAIGGDADLNIKYTEYNVSTIIYRAEIGGRNFEFIAQTNKDEDTLKMLLEHHEKTFIYVKKTDPNYYYFDLEFLKN